MQVKGTTILARREQITRMFGTERWEEFMKMMAERDSAFEDRIFVTSHVSLESFLRFNELLIDTFFAGDQGAYSLIGSTAAEWVFTEGPYEGVLERGRDGLTQFIETVPLEVWDKYYDFGELSVDVGENELTVRMSGIPVRHPYFELTVSGFMVKAVELAGLKSPIISLREESDEGTIVFLVEHGGWVGD